MANIETVLRHYFTEKVEIEGYDVAKKGDLYYIEYTGIVAHELSENIKTIVTTSEGDISLTYSPLSYAYIAICRGDVTDNLTGLMRAMYLYYEAA